ncbi:hypothetical protein [uncultured Thiodictyon sp.]|uniref:hypothetical protein n=1 Tax=uncultured Thiodictyon sp. TaxID=1846217 RepID=UPI0025EC3ACD|nr:hypothetical protein [uncultured Thiodictyon sp.]
MLTSKDAPDPTPESEPAQRLMRLYCGLGNADQHSLLAFAEFLARGGRLATAPAPSPDETPDEHRCQEPRTHPRPAQETVIAAIRRLTLTYAMLDRDPMLHETAALMTAHVLHGRPAPQVIDDLEALFLRHFQNARTGLHRGG